MRATKLILVAVIAVALPGCSIVSPFGGATQEETAEAARQIQALLGRFEKAVQADDADAIVAMLSPMLPESSILEIESDIRIALWTMTYGGYKLVDQSIAKKISRRQVRDGRVVLNVPFRSGSGRILEDRFVFRYAKGQWYIGDVHMRQPEPGDPLDIPPDQRRQIMAKVGACVDALKQGDAGFGTFVMALDAKRRNGDSSDDAFRKHYAEWWRSIQVLFEAQLRAITFSRERTRILYDAKDQVAVLVPLEMKHPPTADTKFEKVVLLFLLARDGDKWQLVDLKSSKKESMGSKFKRLMRLK